MIFDEMICYNLIILCILHQIYMPSRIEEVVYNSCSKYYTISKPSVPTAMRNSHKEKLRIPLSVVRLILDALLTRGKAFLCEQQRSIVPRH